MMVKPKRIVSNSIIVENIQLKDGESESHLESEFFIVCRNCHSKVDFKTKSIDTLIAVCPECGEEMEAKLREVCD